MLTQKLRRKSGAIVAAVVAFSVFALSIQVAGAVENGGIGGRPAFPREDNTRSESIFLHELSQGQSVDEGVKLFNNTDSNKIIEVYAVDALVASGGAFSCEQKADSVDETGSWIKLSQEKIEVPARQQRIVPFSIVVPADADVGEHNACIAIAAIEPPSESGVQGVQLSFRSAIRVAITVPGEIIKLLEIASVAAEVRGDDVIVTQSLRNSGNVSLDSDIKTQVKTIFGSSRQEIGGEFVVLAGKTADINYDFDRPYWGGWYRLVTSAVYSDDTNISLGEDGGSQKTVTSTMLVFVTPAPLALAIYALVVVGLASLLLWMVYSRRKKRALLAKAHKHTVAEKDDIQSVARLYSVSWKKLAKYNGIKAPYTLLPGTEILVPQAKLPSKEVVVDSSEGKKVVKTTTRAKKTPSKPKTKKKTASKPKAKKSSNKK
jgi:hypothetical protein